MHVYDNRMSHALSPLDFGGHALFVELTGIVLIGEITRIASIHVVTIRIAEHGDGRPIALHEMHRFAIRIGGLASNEHDLLVLGEQALRARDAVFTLVPRVIRVEVRNVKANIGEGVNR